MGDNAETPSELDVRYLDPGDLTVTKLAGGTYRATIAGERTVLRVRFLRAFPVSLPDRLIELRDGNAERVGMLNNLDGLDAASRAHVLAGLEEQYFQPQIREIHELREEFGAQFWRVRTDRGELEFSVNDPRQNLRILPPRRVRVIDIDNNVYEIADLDDLPAGSRMQVERVL